MALVGLQGKIWELLTTSVVTRADSAAFYWPVRWQGAMALQGISWTGLSVFAHG